jgi:TolB protein
MDVDSRPIAWVLGIDGSGLRKLAENATNPTWSRDGKWIYFVSKQSGDLQVYKLPANSDAVKDLVPIQVTQGGGGRAMESPDGQFLYYRREDPEIWRVPAGGGEEERILEGVESWISWAIGKQGIYYIDYQAAPPLIKYFDISTKKTSQIAEVDEDCFGLSVSPDGNLILYNRSEQGNRDIMLVENFH